MYIYLYIDVAFVFAIDGNFGAPLAVIPVSNDA